MVARITGIFSLLGLASVAVAVYAFSTISSQRRATQAEKSWLAPFQGTPDAHKTGRSREPRGDAAATSR